jgi:hypothetical protein
VREEEWEDSKGRTDRCASPDRNAGRRQFLRSKILFAGMTTRLFTQAEETFRYGRTNMAKLAQGLSALSRLPSTDTVFRLAESVNASHRGKRTGRRMTRKEGCGGEEKI